MGGEGGSWARSLGLFCGQISQAYGDKARRCAFVELARSRGR